jgi:phosphoglycerate dehydrogenase-like enzyme
MFPAMIETVTRLLPEDDVRVCLQNEVSLHAPWAEVLIQEPPGKDHPLVNHDKVVVTPHTAGSTKQSFDTLGSAVAKNIERLKNGEALKHTAGA